MKSAEEMMRSKVVFVGDIIPYHFSYFRPVSFSLSLSAESQFPFNDTQTCTRLTPANDGSSTKATTTTCKKFPLLCS